MCVCTLNTNSKHEGCTNFNGDNISPISIHMT